MGPREGAIRPAAHRDVVVDVDEAAREAAREQARHEKRYVTEALQGEFASGDTGRLERIGEHQRERLERPSVRIRLIQALRPGEQSQHVDYISLGPLVHLETLIRERSTQRAAEEFREVGRRDDSTSMHFGLHPLLTLHYLSGSDRSSAVP